jgi:hypothetical protein
MQVSFVHPSFIYRWPDHAYRRQVVCMLIVPAPLPEAKSEQYICCTKQYSIYPHKAKKYLQNSTSKENQLEKQRRK